MDTIWDNPKALEHLEMDRKEKRLRYCKNGGYLTFDCFNLKSRGAKAYCSKRKRLNVNSADGTMNLISVLRGTTSTVCKGCEFYTGKVTAMSDSK